MAAKVRNKERLWRGGIRLNEKLKMQKEKNNEQGTRNFE